MNCRPLALVPPGVVVVETRLSPALTLNWYQSLLTAAQAVAAQAGDVALGSDGQTR